jgi:hypothetical protein
MPSTTVQRGNVSTTIIAQVSLTPASVGATTSAEQSFTVPGILPNDQISAVSLQAAWTSLTSLVSFRAISANTLGVSFSNGTAGSLTPPAGVYFVEINRAEALPLPANAV